MKHVPPTRLEIRNIKCFIYCGEYLSRGIKENYFIHNANKYLLHMKKHYHLFVFYYVFQQFNLIILHYSI